MTTTVHQHVWQVLDEDLEHVYLWCPCGHSSRRPNLTGYSTQELMQTHARKLTQEDMRLVSANLVISNWAF